MNHFATRAELKARARQSLMGHYFPLSGAFLTIGLLQYLIVIPPSLMNIQPPFGMLLYYGAYFALELFYGVFQAGLAFLFLSNACGRPVGMNGIFSGFWNNPVRAIMVRFFPALLLLIPDIAPTICLTQFFDGHNQKWLWYGILITLILLPYTFFVEILYSQAFYVMLDYPDMEATECLRYARHLMKGNMLRFLWLRLSFLPLVILGFLSCGIGLLFVYPYREQTYADFYLDLVSQKR